jgi:hypothetical protein
MGSKNRQLEFSRGNSPHDSTFKLARLFREQTCRKYLPTIAPFWLRQRILVTENRDILCRCDRIVIGYSLQF